MGWRRQCVQGVTADAASDQNDNQNHTDGDSGDGTIVHSEVSSTRELGCGGNCLKVQDRSKMYADMFQLNKVSKEARKQTIFLKRKPTDCLHCPSS